MKATVDAKTLAAELALVNKVTEPKAHMPILAHVSVVASEREGLVLRATDLEVTLSTSIPAQVEREGGTLLPGRKLQQVLGTLKGETVFDHQGKDDTLKSTITNGRTKFDLFGIATEDFPAFPQTSGVKLFRVEGKVLAELIRRTEFAITTEDARYYLAGALLVLNKDSVAMVASDGHRLAHAKAATVVDTDEEFRILVPRKAINALGYMLDEEPVLIGTSFGHVVVKMGNRTLTAKRVEGQFPAYEKVLEQVPGNPITMKVASDALGVAFKRVGLMGKCVQVSPRAEGLSLHTAHAVEGTGEETVEVRDAQVPSEIKLGINGAYLRDVLDSTDCLEVTLAFKESESAMFVTPSDTTEGLTSVVAIMPMRL